MLDRLELTLGPAAASAATLYVRPHWAASAQVDPAWRLGGSIRGPHCRHARTLPGEFPLHDRGREPTWLGEFNVREPCYWSPDLPFLYDLVLELRDDERTVGQWTRTTGLRSFAAVGNGLRLNGQPLVVRAWRSPSDPAAAGVDWAALRRERLALWSESAVDDALVAQASLHGALVVGHHAEESAGPAALRLDRQRCAFVVPPLDANRPHGDRPVIALRHDESLADAAAARAACERLQADCAPYTDLAGYVV